MLTSMKHLEQQNIKIFEEYSITKSTILTFFTLSNASWKTFLNSELQRSSPSLFYNTWQLPFDEASSAFLLN